MNYDPFTLKNKTIIITGASSGIGKQCAISCSNFGAKVLLFGRNVERLKETIGCLKNKAMHEYFSVDLTEYEQVADIINKINDKHGKIDGVINSAGISKTIPLKMTKPEILQTNFAVNVTSAVNLSRIVSQKRYFSQDGGSIIFISSVMGISGESGKTAYSLSKGALISGCRSMAVELADRKIRVNSISPGVVETPMSDKAVYRTSDDALKKIKNLHPLGFGEVKDIAAGCVYLLSDAAKWVTGINLVIDGGYTAR